jgi:hypothetical protein
MLATNQMAIANSGTKHAAKASAKSPFTRPAWVNRLLGVRPAPVLLETSDLKTPTMYTSVEGVSSATTFRSHPR